MDIPMTYCLQHRIDSFSEYVVPKAYENTRKVELNKPITYKDRETFIAGIQKKSKGSPGVGKYIINPEVKRKNSYSKLDFKKMQSENLGKKTFLDDEIKKKLSVPAVGKYDLEQDKTEEIRKKYKTLKDSEKKKSLNFRPTIFEAVNVDTARLAPGCYQSIKTFGSKSMLGSISPEHKRSVSLPKLPSAADYDPIPVDYQTFKRKQSTVFLGNGKVPSKEKKKEEKNKYETLGPGPKYSLISDWVLVRDKNNVKRGQNYFASLSNLRPAGIYH